ncbi:diaminopimelate epimerase [Stackebrandtia endophytica]|uniref:Diaminopimelate epimerase n=1 Tax=Stackebrandtia endophytica TaxID=1496996 RepID=A0A543B2X2_9ACTN|nr:diaminopimelate epimerase [Stackebrandtia endophytica]TQL79176.1 diaminopimelate epimerase [Stackebrandtia endophytica]
MRFVKGHGTGNDFVIVADVDNDRPLSVAAIARLCDRRRGVGGDGLLRVVRAAKHPDGVGQAAAAEWFMDYYNADGSIAEMCGNGVRVFVRYLVAEGLVETNRVPVATRAGVRDVLVENDQFSVDMGAARTFGTSTVAIGGEILSGRHISMGNPHLVCRVTDPTEYDLTVQPEFDTELFPTGVNVELTSPTDTGVRMRVHERGVGETQSCGTGACAVAVDALGGPGTCTVDVPGGRLTVTITEETVILTGPAVLVAEGHTLV